MIDSIRIAVASSRAARDVRENGKHLREQMTQARDAGARLVHFPEYALSGHPKEHITDWATVDWRVLRDELEVTAAHARQLGLWTALGCNHRLTPPYRPHNSLYVISDEGALVGRYDKRFCSNTEINDWYSPGFEPLVFEVDGFKFGAMICIELAFPHLFAGYEALGVDCVLFSTSGCDELTRVLTRAHAVTNCYWISLSATARPGGAGGLIGPDGKFIIQSPSDGSAGLAVGVLDRLDARYDIALNKARPWRAAANQGEIYEARRVDDPRSRDRVSFLMP
jgi:predicted amidohydrolase